MNSNVPYSKKEIAILRAGGYDGSNPQSHAILRQNATTVFISAYEAMYKKPLAGKIENSTSSKDRSWNAELLLSDLRKKHSNLKNIDGNKIASGEEDAIQAVVVSLWSEGRRLLDEKLKSSNSSIPSKKAPPKNDGMRNRQLKKS